MTNLKSFFEDHNRIKCEGRVKVAVKVKKINVISCDCTMKKFCRKM